MLISGTFVSIRDAYNGISNPMDSNPSAVESKNKNFLEYLDLR